MSPSKTEQTRNPLLACLALLILTSAFAGLVAADSWPTGGDSERRNSSSTENAPASPYYSWVFPRALSDPVHANGRIYVVGADRVPQTPNDSSVGLSLYSLLEQTGSVVWESQLYPAGQIPVFRSLEVGTPTHSEGRIFFLDNSATVWSFSASDGSLLWKAKVGTDAWAHRTSPLVVGSTLVVPIDNHPDTTGIGQMQLVALDATNGGQKWRVDQMWNGGAELASDGTRVYVTNGATLSARNLADGILQWSLMPGNGGGISDAIVTETAVYVVGQRTGQGGAYETSLYALNPSSGQTLWSLGFAGGENTCCSAQYENIFPPAVDSNLIVVSGRGQLRGINPTTRDVVWTRSLDGRLQGAPVLTSDSVLVARFSKYVDDGQVRLNGGNLFALDRSNGQTRWEFQGSDPVSASGTQGRFVLAEQRILGGFRHFANYQIPQGQALIALGEDLVAPAWPSNAHFIASLHYPQVKLQWGAANDLNMKGFQIQRASSANGPWTQLAETAWTGTDATFVDVDHTGLRYTDQPGPGTHHYRVIPIDRSLKAGVPLLNQMTVTGPTMTTVTDPAPTTSTGTATTSPPTSTAQPTVTPTGPAPPQATGSPALPPCGAEPVRTSGTWYPRILAPSNGATLSGAITISGDLQYHGGGSPPSPPAETRVFARIGNQVALYAPVNGSPWQVSFHTPSAEDGSYMVWAETSGAQSTQFSNVACVELSNGKPVRFTELATWIEPQPAPQGQEAEIVIFAVGESTSLHQGVDLVHYIDGEQVGRVNLGLQDYGDIDSDGLRDFRLGDHFNLVLGQPNGIHQHWAGLTFSPGSPNSYTFNTAPVTFQIGPIPVTSGSTPTASRSPIPTTLPPTPPGENFRIEGGAIALDASLPKVGDKVQVYAKAVNQGTRDAHGRAALAIVAPDGSVEYAARLPVSVPPLDEELVQVQWSPKSEGLYSIFAVIEDSDQLGAAEAARTLAHATRRDFAVGAQPVDRPSLVLSAGLINIGTIEEGSSRTIPVAVTAYGQDAEAVRLDVFEDAGLDVLSLTPPTLVRQGETVQFYVRITVPNLPANATAQDHRIIVRAANDASSSNVETMDVVAHPVEFRGLPFFGPVATIAVLATAGGASVYFRRRD